MNLAISNTSDRAELITPDTLRPELETLRPEFGQQFRNQQPFHNQQFSNQPSTDFEILRATAIPSLFAKYVSRGRWRLARHLAELDRAIERTIKRPCGRLLITFPPRHGKSEFISKYFTAWYTGTFPDRRTILTSYEAGFAAQWGRKARDILEEWGPSIFGVSVSKKSSAADRWDIADREGGMQTAGAGGSITGKGADLLIVDDPHKNYEEANSQLIRDRIWDWWQSTAYTRLEPNGTAIIIHTRWHEDDLIGRILKQQTEEPDENERWEIINFPAINSHGEALWPERYSVSRLRQIERSVGAWIWSSLYQGEPIARSGEHFKVDQLKIVSEVPSDLRCIRSWDLAATDGGGDFTAGVKMATNGDGWFFILDVERGQWDSGRRNNQMRLTAGMDGRACRIRLPQDPGQAGKSQAADFTRLLAGFSLRIKPISGDKMVRADPFASQVNSGNVYLLSDEHSPRKWVRAFIDELRAFPRGKNDDQVDAAADAFNELCAKRKFVVGTDANSDTDSSAQ